MKSYEVGYKVNFVRWRYVKFVDILLFFLVPFSFFGDFFYGLLNYIGIETSLSPGILFRGICVIISFFITFKYFNKKKLFFVLISFVLFLSVCIGILKEFSFYSFFYNVRWFFKTIYGFALLNIFFYLSQKYVIKLEKILEIVVDSGVLLAFFVILPYLLGFGFKTYGDYAYGFKGLIIANNDLSLGLIISFSVGLFVLIYNFTLSNLIEVFCISLSMVLVGTRASLFSIGLVPLFILMVYLFGKKSRIVFPFINRRKRIAILISIFSMFVVFIGVFYFTFSKIIENNYQRQKMEILLEGNLPRFLLIKSGISYIKSRSAIYDLFGEGMFSYLKGVYKFYPGYSKDRLKWTEVDWIDIYGGYGIVGIVIIYGFFIFHLISSLCRFVLKRFLIDGLVFASLVFFIGHSALAGHAIMTPIPTTLIMLLIFAKNTFKNKKGVYYYPYRHRS